jgi:uncharacterized protein YbjT (DUF2867 family)
VDVVAGDVTRPDTLQSAMLGISAAYYLIHNMSAGHGYHRLDLESARNFSQAALAAGVEHIIYLGGLANPNESDLSMHMRSRIESGMVLREAGVPVTEFRAGVVVGPGSVSFEMIRFIAEQFPLMVGPQWLRHHSQPVATRNVLDFLMAALTTPAARGKVIEIGSQEVYSYIEVMARYAKIRGLKRMPLLLPIVPVWFMAYFISILTPVQRSYAFPLVDGLKNDSLVQDRTPLDLFPQIDLLDFATAVQIALQETHPTNVERVWLDQDQESAQIRHEGMFIDYRRAYSAEPVEILFKSICETAWGNGPRIGLLSSFKVDFITEDTLRLKASQKLPGDFWLEWKLTAGTAYARGTALEQTAFFAPKGLPGFLCAYLFGWFQRSSLRKFLERLLAQRVVGSA